MKVLPIAMVCVWACIAASAQTEPVLENNPTFLKWKQVNTDHFRVLFPAGFEEPAQRVANNLESVYAPEARSMGRTPRKISVILQNQSTVSNAFVSMIPRRTEFYTMPTQDYKFLGTNDWLDLISSHEYRHVVQYRHAIRGLNRFIYYVFGPTTFVGSSHVAAPQWFWEGDAVATETAFTPSGRGRIPYFGLVFKTNLLEGRTFNYHKQYLRSYKHNIPDHYVLGYHMVSYLRRKTQDPEIWSKVTERAWNVPIMPFTFSNALHRETGSYVMATYNEMASTLKKEWQAEIDKLDLTPFEIVLKRQGKAYTDYFYPQTSQDGSVLVMKKGIGDIEKFIRIRDGVPSKEFTPGIINDAGMLSAEAGKIAWTEYGFDPRWRVKTFSRVRIFDEASGRRFTIGGTKGRLMGASLSPDGKLVAVVSSDNDYHNELIILDAVTGRKLAGYTHPENRAYSMSRFSNNGKRLVVLETSKQGRRIVSFDDKLSEPKELLDAGSENVGHPVVWNDHLFFNSPVSGIDNIYVLDLVSGTRHQVTTSKYGAYNPSISKDGKWIYYNDQARDGLDVVRIPYDVNQWKAYQASGESTYQSLANNLVNQEKSGEFWKAIQQKPLTVKKYSKISGVFNPYSWGAFVTNDLAQINVGVLTRDILSTTSIGGGYMYDLNERTSAWKANISYQALYPIIDGSFFSGDRRNTDKAFGNEIEFKWKEMTVEGGLRIPLVLTNSKYSRSLTIGNYAGYTHASSFQNTVKRNGEIIYRGPQRITPLTGLNDSLVFIYKDQLNDGDLVYNKFTFAFSNVLKRSQRDFLYKWGQTLNLESYTTPYGGDFKGRLFAATATFYFPGLVKHHFFYTRFGYQESQQAFETNTYTFRNRIAKPRGQSFPDDANFVSGSANYALPLWYPDIAFGPVLNIQRIKANLFYDIGKGDGHVYYYNTLNNRVYYTTSDQIYQSVGIETTFDINVFRILPKIELGFRSTYRIANDYNTSGMVFEFLVGNIGF